VIEKAKLIIDLDKRVLDIVFASFYLRVGFFMLSQGSNMNLAIVIAMLLYLGIPSEGTISDDDSQGSITLEVLHLFNGTDGRGPLARPQGRFDYSNNVWDLYGVTGGGGIHGNGTVYKIYPKEKTVTTVAYLDGENGAQPTGVTYASPPFGEDFLAGVAYYGGAHGLGTIFRVNPKSKTVSTEYHFDGSKGAHPMGILSRSEGTNEDHYGITAKGGSTGNGTAFLWDSVAGSITLLKPRTGVAVAFNYPTSLARDSHKGFAGTTLYGCGGTGAFYTAGFENYVNDGICVEKAGIKYPLSIASSDVFKWWGTALDGSLFRIEFTDPGGWHIYKEYQFEGYKKGLVPYGIVRGSDGYGYGVAGPYDDTKEHCGLIFRTSSDLKTVTTLYTFSTNDTSMVCHPKAAPFEVEPGVFIGMAVSGGPFGAGGVYMFTVNS